ncbi:PRTRC system protein C [Burkholderia glumae]|uniref:PRTRC system protein C n=2 Tax=Burkholderia TaxID=32008 RepID=A0ABY5B8I7_BURGL|nr:MULTISPECIES: PRTRC system protein C [Burkholderia]USS42778.1 PRTRC system protein C [Burkholderia glumae]
MSEDAMQIENLQREFSYNGAKLADPAPNMTPNQIREFYSQTYPELTNAEVEGPVINGNRSVYTFRRAVGTKGTGGAAEELDTPQKISAVLAVVAPGAIRSYLVELDRFASAHVCPLLDEEVAFIDALHARYAK